MSEDSVQETAKSMLFMKKKPRQQRAITTVEAILEAGAQLLIMDGLAGTSTNRIAARAGVSIGSLYEYFPGKEAILAEVSRRMFMDWYVKLTAPPRPVAPAAVIRHLVHSRIAFARDNLALYTAVMQEIPKLALEDTDQFVFGDFMKLSLEYFAQHGQELKPLSDPTFTAEFLMRSVSATINEFALNAPEQLEQPHLEQEMVKMLEAYLLTQA